MPHLHPQVVVFVQQYLNTIFINSVSDPDPAIRSVDLDPDPEGQKLPAKIEKSQEILCFEVLDVLF
jgi:hypothetical protein